MALQSLQLFLNQISINPEPLKTTILHIIFDMLMVHEYDFLKAAETGDNVRQF